MNNTKLKDCMIAIERKGYQVEDADPFNIFFVILKDGKVIEVSGRQKLIIEMYDITDRKDINTDKSSEDFFNDLDSFEQYFEREQEEDNSRFTKISSKY